MNNRLEPIILQKQHEVAALRTLIATQPDHAINQLLQGKQQRNSAISFKQALRGTSLAVIAEIKRKSPSKGVLAEIPDPVQLAHTYAEGGASALSILTDTLFFGGSLNDLNRVNHALAKPRPPILRKDFLIDEIQIAEAIVYGADAVLCIVAVLGKRTKAMLDAARIMGIDVLVEVHTRQELEIALDCGAEIIGVNNRDLTSFEIDTNQALRLVEEIPRQLIRVAESGILTPELAKNYCRAGFDAVLIGEALVKSPNPSEFIGACRQRRSLLPSPSGRRCHAVTDEGFPSQSMPPDETLIRPSGTFSQREKGVDNCLIKICGICTPELAYAAGLAGADFIGIVFHPQSRRCVTLAQARRIARAALDAGAIPVAVFVEHTATEMQMICQATGIKVVQLHGCVSRQQHHELPASYQRIDVQSVDAPSSVAPNPARDYVLFDSPDPGKGIAFDWKQFHYAGPCRLGIAGGLTAGNVAKAIKQLKPALVDVSSGVENLSGEKDITLIKQFIGACNDANQTRG